MITNASAQSKISPSTLKTIEGTKSILFSKPSKELATQNILLSMKSLETFKNKFKLGALDRYHINLYLGLLSDLKDDFSEPSEKEKCEKAKITLDKYHRDDLPENEKPKSLKIASEFVEHLCKM